MNVIEPVGADHKVTSCKFEVSLSIILNKMWHMKLGGDFRQRESANVLAPHKALFVDPQSDLNLEKPYLFRE